MLRITIYDEFFKQYFTSEFETVEQAKELYSVELDCMPDDIIVTKIEPIERS